MSGSRDRESVVARTHDDLIARRLPLFAPAGVALSAVWLVTLALESPAVTPTAAGLLLAQALGVGLVVGRAGRMRSSTAAVALVVVLASPWTLFFLLHGGRAVVLDILLVALCTTAGAAFALGWRLQAVTLALVLGPAVLIDRYLEQLMPALQSVVALAMGALIAVGIAEMSHRRVRTASLLRERERQALARLVASRDAYRDLAEAMPVGVFLVQDGRIRWANPAAAVMTGRGLDELCTRRFDEVVHGLDAAHRSGWSDTPAMPGRDVARACTVRTRGGEERWVEVSTAPIEYEGAPATLMTTIDVTARRSMETAMRESEARFRRLFESNIVGVIFCDTTGVISDANDAFLSMVGYSRAALPMRWDTLTPEEWKHLDDHAQREIAAHGAVVPWEKEYVHREGHRVPVLVGVALIEGSDTNCIAVVIDLTKRKEAETALRTSLEDLRASEDTLRRLARRQTAVREEERKRLGLDLHDDVCQELVGIGIMLESVCHHLRDDAGLHERVQRAITYVGEVGDHLRGLARELRPLQLHDLGLEGTLRSLAQGMSSETTRIRATFPTVVPRLDENTELGFYRVAQEALANAVRHADAHRIEVMLAAVDGRLRLEVSDDGRGFEPGSNRTGALGLASMEERALALGGRLAVWSAPGRGTTVRLDCAIRDAQPASSAA